MEFMQSDWGWTVILDLFLGGLGGASLAITALMRLIGRQAFPKTVKFGAWIGTGCLAIGVLCLLADVGQPLRAMLMPISFSHFTSWMAFGAWFMFCAVVFAGLFALSSTPQVGAKLGEGVRAKLDVLQKVFAAGGLVFGLAVVVYTGFLVCSAPGIPFWNTVLVPLGFAPLSLLAGAATVHFLVSKFEGAEDERPRAVGVALLALRIAVIAFAVLSGIALAVFLSNATALGGTAAACSAAVTVGGWAAVFWALVMVVGLAIPAVLALMQLVTKKTCWKAALVLLACVVVGGIVWRMVLIALGAHEALPAPVVPQAFLDFSLHALQ